MKMCSAAGSRSLLPCLPSDVAQQIFRNLSMRDICNVAQASRSLWDITCQLSSLELTFHVAASTESFLLFLRRRSCKEMEVAYH